MRPELEGRRSDPVPSVQLLHTPNKASPEPGYAGLCSSLTHTHTRFPKVFEREIVFFFLLEFDTFDCGAHILSQGRTRDVIRGPTLALAFLELSEILKLLENVDEPEGEISTQVEHLSLEISSFEMREQRRRLCQTLGFF